MSKIIESLKNQANLPWWHYTRLFGWYFAWKNARLEAKEFKIMEKKRKEQIEKFHLVYVMGGATNIVKDMAKAASGDNIVNQYHHTYYLYENSLGERKITIRSSEPEGHSAERLGLYRDWLIPWRDGYYTTEAIKKANQARTKQ